MGDVARASRGPGRPRKGAPLGPLLRQVTTTIRSQQQARDGIRELALQSPLSRRGLLRMCSQRAETFEKWIPWPALAASWREDEQWILALGLRAAA